MFPELEVLPAVSVHAAVAQEILRTITRVKMGGSADVSSTEPSQQHGQLILSERYLFWLHRDDYRGCNISHTPILRALRWSTLWEQVHRVEAVSAAAGTSRGELPLHSLRIHLDGGDPQCPVVIPCASRGVLVVAYEVFKSNQHRVHKSDSNRVGSGLLKAGGGGRALGSAVGEGQGGDDAWISLSLDED